MPSLFFEHALLPDGWAEKALIEYDQSGWITSVTAGADGSSADARRVIGVPGMPNLHSHAFQRAMAGLAETRGETADSFWTWRRIMYRFVETLTPADLTAITAQLHVEMLEAGFTSLAEFHYLHHQADGRPHDDIGAMSSALAEAAAATGMGMTFLPVFYAHGGFGGAAPGDGQRRFINSLDRYGDLVARIREIAGELDNAAVGIAPHSLRAVTPENLAEIRPLAGDGPVHIHIAEQVKEVEDCVAWSGARPVEWLMKNVDVDAKWCLVHATHMTPAERRALAKSGAVAGLCPITEANLGDGIFDGAAYIADGGHFGVGSDSNILISLAEELRVLEYSQRLRDRARNVMITQPGSTGGTLFRDALAGGTRAVGRKVGQLAPGCRADMVSLDHQDPALIARSGDAWLDGWVFAGGNDVVRDVWVGGKHLVTDGRHKDRDGIRRTYRSTLTKLLEA